MKKLLLFLIVIGLGWAACFHEAAASWTGRPAPDAPRQTDQALPAAFPHGTYTIHPLARYTITAVVLSRDHYRFDETAALAPVDLALGWGVMSEAAVINALHITQSGRWYEYHWSGAPPAPPGVIARHSANTHCLPANAALQRQLLAIQHHDLVSLDGFLVEVTRADGWHWRSSLSRDDTAGGACEVFWITQISRRPL